MKSRKAIRHKLTLVVLAALLLGVVPVALGLEFGDVPVGYWAYNQIDRISNLHITAGCGGGNYCPERNITRAEMAVYVDNLTKAYTTEPEPYIVSFDHQANASPDAPAVIAKSYDGDGVQGISYGGSYANSGVYGETDSTSYSDAGIEGVSTGTAPAGHFEGAGEADPDIILGGASDSNDNGNLWSDPSYLHSDLVFKSYDEFHVYVDVNDDEDGHFVVYNGADADVFTVDEAGNTSVDGTLTVADDILYLRRSAGLLWADNSATAALYLAGNGDVYAELDNDNELTDECFYIRSGGNANIASWCESKGTAAGVQALAVDTSAGTREMYVMGATEVWFEDFGTAALVDGQATVAFDPVFIEAANLEVDYHVYLTALSDQPVLLYVAAKTPTGFEVRGVTLDGQPAGAGFEYRVVAKRAGYEGWRLQAVEPAEEAEPGADQGEAPPALDVGEDAPIPGDPVVVVDTEESE